MKVTHPAHLASLNTAIQSHKKRNRNDSGSPTPAAKQQKTDGGLFNFRANVPPSQEKVDELIQKFIINGLMPFSICDNDNAAGSAFRELITELQPTRKVICSKTLKNNISSTFNKMKQNVIGILDGVVHVSSTVDCWSTGKRYVAFSDTPSTYKANLIF